MISFLGGFQSLSATIRSLHVSALHLFPRSQSLKPSPTTFGPARTVNAVVFLWRFVSILGFTFRNIVQTTARRSIRRGQLQDGSRHHRWIRKTCASASFFTDDPYITRKVRRTCARRDEMTFRKEIESAFWRGSKGPRSGWTHQVSLFFIQGFFLWRTLSRSKR